MTPGDAKSVRENSQNLVGCFRKILNYCKIHLEVSGLSLLFEQKPCWAVGFQEKYSCVEGLVLVETHCITDCVPPDSFPKHPVTAERKIV